MDEQKLMGMVDRAHRAQREYDEVKASLDLLDAEYAERWRASADPETRERLWLAVQVLEKVKAHFRKVIADGRRADDELRAVEQAGRTKKRLFNIV